LTFEDQRLSYDQSTLPPSPVHGVAFTVLLQLPADLFHEVHPAFLSLVIRILCSVSEAFPVLRTFLRFRIAKFNTSVFSIETVLYPILSAKSLIVSGDGNLSHQFCLKLC
jgi:hypothetical protein